MTSTANELKEIILEELELSEEGDNDKAFRAFTSVMDYLREEVFPKLLILAISFQLLKLVEHSIVK
jgi:hypothetical protein